MGVNLVSGIKRTEQAKSIRELRAKKCVWAKDGRSYSRLEQIA